MNAAIGLLTWAALVASPAATPQEAPIPAARAAAAQEFVVVVHAANPLEQIDRSALGRIFLGQSRSWPDASPVRPVDQSTTSEVRESFCHSVLHQTLPENQAYWQRQILAGRANPPRVKASDAEILAFVAGEPAGVGYVSVTAALPAGVRALAIVDE